MTLRKLFAASALACTLALTSACSLFGGGEAERGADDEITTGGNISAFSMHIGDCIISADLGSQFSEVPAVPCTEPHDTEITYMFDMQDGDYDEDAIDEAGIDQCEKAAIDYVGPNYATVGAEGLHWDYFSPTKESWENMDDREVDCLVYSLSGENDLTSSVKGLGA